MFKKIESRDSLLSQLSNTLDSIFNNDQKYRLMITPEMFGTPEEEKLTKEIIKIDSMNLIIVENIILQHGFYGNSLKTTESRNTMWLVIHHAKIDIREKYTNIFKNALERGELSPQNMATFEV